MYSNHLIRVRFGMRERNTLDFVEEEEESVRVYIWPRRRERGGRFAAGKCPRNDASRWVDGEDLAEIFAGIETPSFFSRLRRARPCSTCRIDSPRIQISLQPGI